jgi:hypothetical protein
MLTTASRLFGEAPRQALSERDGWGTFDYTPYCGSATFEALRRRGCLEGEQVHRSEEFRLSGQGLALLFQFCFRLRGNSPRRSGERASRPIAASAKLLKRYGGPEGARRYLGYHEQTAAYHQRIADRLRASLELYEGSEEQRRDEWAARGRNRRPPS